MSFLRFCFILSLLAIAFGQGSSVQAINYVQIGFVGAGYTYVGGDCFIDYEITGMGNSNDSNTPANLDYFAVIEWVKFPNGSSAVAATVYNGVKGQFFAQAYSLNLVGNNQLYQIELVVYDLSAYPSYGLSMSQLISFILSNSQQSWSAAIFPGDYFVEACPPYQP